jgi:hypothetical protein
MILDDFIMLGKTVPEAASDGRQFVCTAGFSLVHVFADRLPRMHRQGWEGPRASSMTAFAWFVWLREHAGPIILDRIKARELAEGRPRGDAARDQDRRAWREGAL